MNEARRLNALKTIRYVHTCMKVLARERECKIQFVRYNVLCFVQFPEIKEVRHAYFHMAYLFRYIQDLEARSSKLCI